MICLSKLKIKSELVPKIHCDIIQTMLRIYPKIVPAYGRGYCEILPGLNKNSKLLFAFLH